MAGTDEITEKKTRDEKESHEGAPAVEGATETAATTEGAGGQVAMTGPEGYQYPADTPWKDMSDVHARNYWRAQARKHESATNDLRFELDKSKAEKPVDADSLRETVRAEMRAESAQALARADVRTALVARGLTIEKAENLTSVIDANAFLTDDMHTDADKVTAYAETFEPVKGVSWPDMGQGNRGKSGSNATSVEAGREMYRSKFNRK